MAQVSVYTLGVTTQFIHDNMALIENLKVTKAEKIGFNSMEGNEYLVNISVTTKEGYKNKRISMLTNSTYTEYFPDWDDTASLKKNFQTFFNGLAY